MDPDSKLTSEPLDFSEPQVLIYSKKIKFHGLLYIKCHMHCLESILKIIIFRGLNSRNPATSRFHSYSSCVHKLSAKTTLLYLLPKTFPVLCYTFQRLLLSLGLRMPTPRPLGVFLLWKFFGNHFHTQLSPSRVRPAALIGGRHFSMDLSHFCTSWEQRHSLFFVPNVLF